MFQKVGLRLWRERQTPILEESRTPIMEGRITRVDFRYRRPNPFLVVGIPLMVAFRSSTARHSVDGCLTAHPSVPATGP